MLIRKIVLAVVVSCSWSAAAFDQPEVKFFVQRRSAGQMVDCRVGAASLGEWAFVPLSDGSRIEAIAPPPDSEGRSALRVKIVSAQRVTEHEFNLDARLARQSPQFTWSSSRTYPMNGVSIVVESAAMLATTRAHPSWREFDPRLDPSIVKERPIRLGGCGMDNVAAAPSAG